MISILIPVYNEKENVNNLVLQLRKEMRNIEEKFEIIFIDDNSPDGTGEEIKKLIKKYQNVHLLSREGKLGLATAVMDGLKISKGSKIVVMDADLSHPPEKVPELARALENYDVAIGSRYIKMGGVENWPVYRRIISFGATIIAKTILGISASDPMSGFFSVKRKILNNTKISVKGYKLLMNILAKNKGLNICKIPCLLKDRQAGKTKLGALEIINFILDVIRVKFN